MDSLQAGMAEKTTRLADYIDPGSHAQKSEKKDSDNTSSANDIMSMFANILQNQIDVQENNQKKSDASQVQKTDQSKSAAEGVVRDGNQANAAVNNGQNASGNNTKNEINDGHSVEEPAALQNTNGNAAGNGQGTTTAEASTAEESTFMKNLAAFLRQSGMSDEKVEQILSQIKNVAGLNKEKLADGTFAKEMADLLKSTSDRDKHLSKMSAAEKGGYNSWDKSAGLQDVAADASKQEDVLPDMQKQKIFIPGLDTATDMTERDFTMELDIESAGQSGNHLAMKNSLAAVADQRTNLIPGDAASLAKAETTANLRPQLLIEQIVNSKDLLDKGAGRVRLTLNPPSLGTLDMDVRVRNNRVEVMVMADNKDVRQVLQTHLDDLKNALREHGLQVDRFNIQWQDGNQGRAFWEYSGGKLFWDNNSGNAGVNTGDVPKEEYPLQNRIYADNGAGLISVFI
jgi:flagellar hook-length control protein FliK